MSRPKNLDELFASMDGEKFPTLKHKTPCNECPWRREHPAGWLGGYEPEEFTVQVHRDGPPVPCHKTVPKGGEMTAAVAMCAGALIHMKNSCKSARHPAYGDALDQVKADSKTVFDWPHEFLEYHRDPDGWMKKAGDRAKEKTMTDEFFAGYLTGVATFAVIYPLVLWWLKR